MIADTLENLGSYFGGIEEVLEFLSSLDAGVQAGRHEIEGEDMYVIVSRYDTRPREECRPEAHREYVDIQCLVEGTEAIEWYPLEGLAIETPYDGKKDVAFFRRPEAEGSRIVISRGVFAAFFPRDAHMPQLRCAGGPEPVIKAVVKIRAGLLQGAILNPESH